MQTNIAFIEEAIVDAFKKTVIDYRDKKIEIEEDFRACLYYHLRPFIEEHQDLKMLLSHNLFFRNDTKKPDIVIFREDAWGEKEYLIAIELKNTNRINGQWKDYSFDDGKKDRVKLSRWSKRIPRAFFIHIDKSDKDYSYRNLVWKGYYYRELCHLLDENKTYYYKWVPDVKKYII